MQPRMYPVGNYARVLALTLITVLLTSGFARSQLDGSPSARSEPLPESALLTSSTAVETAVAASPPAAAQSTSTPSRGTILVASLTVFVLAIFVGFEVIAKVPPTLHTPLMSGSNAISGITVVGAIIATGYQGNWFATLLGLIAIVLAMINVVGGFLVTHRMLKMFKRR